MKMLDLLRKKMLENKIDFYIIPSSDEHQSEYVAEYYKGRAKVSGFTGSAGTLLVGLNEAFLWTDGRYFIQADSQLKGSGIELMKMATPGYPKINEWIELNLKENDTLGIDGRVLSVFEYKDLKKISNKIGFNINIDIDLLEYIWEDRPSLPSGKIIVHSERYSGESVVSKIKRVREKMKELCVNSYIISSLDDICWLLNIRGTDIKYNPVVLSHIIVDEGSVKLFIDSAKIDKEVKNHLDKEGISVYKYNEIYEEVKNISGNILIDPNKVNSKIYENINKNCNVLEKTNITTNLKAIKNKNEIANYRNCQVRDGVAMVKFIKWLKENVSKGEITEITAAEKLYLLRSEGELFKGESFGTIAAYKEHAAMMHYSATEESDYLLEAKGMFLVDSGGQYLDGTTDITRTIVLGKLTYEEIRDFTLVLKGHIALSKARFLKGSKGENLDILARNPLWQYGIDYKCGTGHGIGFFLNVHEGPQRISQNITNVPLEEGMLVTNEPGVYKEGKFGIRTENILHVIKDVENEFGEFLKFEMMSYCPIDIEAIDVSLLNCDERKWINEYHEEVYKKLSPYLNEEEKLFLRKETRKI